MSGTRKTLTDKPMGKASRKAHTRERELAKSARRAARKRLMESADKSD